MECKIDGLVNSISSVSEVSITAAAIMLALKNGGTFQGIDDFKNRVVNPLKTLGQLDLRNQIINRALKKSSFSLSLPHAKFSEVFPEVLDDLLLHGTKISELTDTHAKWYCSTTCLDTMRDFYFSPDKIRKTGSLFRDLHN